MGERVQMSVAEAAEALAVSDDTIRRALILQPGFTGGACAPVSAPGTLLMASSPG